MVKISLKKNKAFQEITYSGNTTYLTKVKTHVTGPACIYQFVCNTIPVGGHFPQKSNDDCLPWLLSPSFFLSWLTFYYYYYLWPQGFLIFCIPYFHWECCIRDTHNWLLVTPALPACSTEKHSQVSVSQQLALAAPAKAIFSGDGRGFSKPKKL